jgi:hypothetical protein
MPSKGLSSHPDFLRISHMPRIFSP